MPHVKSINAALVAIILVCGAALLWYTSSEQPSTIEILTTPLQVLEPHEHDTAKGDTIEQKGHGVTVTSDVYTVPDDIWITGIEVEVNNAPQLILHHMQLFNLETKNELCPNYPGSIAAAGQDTPLLTLLPSPYGEFVPKGSRLAILGMLHNPAPPLGYGETYRDVTVGFKLHVVQNGARTKKLTLYRVMLEDTPYCSIGDEAGTFTVPPHSENFTKESDDITLPNQTRLVFKKSGHIVLMRAHLHPWEGGKALEVRLNDTIIDTLVPEKVSDTPLRFITPGSTLRMFPFSEGDVISLKATYDNPHDIAETGPMGSIRFFVSYDDE